MTQARRGREHLKQKPETGPGEPVPTPYPFAKAPAFSKTVGTQPEGLPLHSCMGLNSCKASDRYGLEGHFDPVTGTNVQNDCAGQGYCATTPAHTCHVQNSCKNQGGCGLYGTSKELENPAHNDCRSLGSCAVPINAERFSTDGANRGKSVWQRARKVFEETVWPQTRAELLNKQSMGKVASDCALPKELGDAPAEFEGKGPAYQWVSNNNMNRGNMTACGSSGTSGAGGCS
ncbi:hypothetical protein [uncultured Erythrobacter sp.]|uniref:hypothetical protein n=1 Tax=uncultured Erythrobacter sp. TaxID=263913 RepID=UPI002610D7E5|nr:hypothetical protein [uncultured Erythrobacter sp.]